MMKISFLDFWQCATGEAGQQPFPYQERLAAQPWPDMLKVPTGLGKTAAVMLSWAYRRLSGDPQTPRRLVFCLPMRTLVEQTTESTRLWLENLHRASLNGKACIPEPDEIYTLMGGEADDGWIQNPERPAILIGTQDMLLSRALMRGYGVGRGRWPVDFALLHNDVMWVFDEVQLMAAGVPTSTQLEGFRRKIGTMTDCRSLWMSATLEREWLDTIDLDGGPLVLHGLEADDREDGIVRTRLGAEKRLGPAATAVTAEALKDKGLADYAAALAREILDHHQRGKTTLVIVNRVRHAQAIHKALTKAQGESARPSLVLIHSRYRPSERRQLNKQLAEDPDDEGRIVIATQAVEAGVDVTSAVLFTELAPWASLVQRFGRLNRGGEETTAHAFWIDIADEEDEKDRTALALPYLADELASARERLTKLDEVSPNALEAFSLDLAATWQVLRRKDLYSLFDTDPDLTGFDVDISPYVRGASDTDVHAFWRTLEDVKKGPLNREADRPHRDDLCPVPIGQARAWLGKPGAKGRAFSWDWVEKQWNPLDRPWPGALVLVDATLGGYDEILGFDPDTDTAVAPVATEETDTPASLPDGSDDDQDTYRFETTVPLSDHLRRVEAEARTLCKALSIGPAEADAVATAALWHDVGKAHEVFLARCGFEPDAAPLAKTPAYDWRRKTERNRKYFRHELASALVWLKHGAQNEEGDLVAYLIAAHHGKVRMGLRALPAERGPDDRPEARFARGVWDGDSLPALSSKGLTIPDTELTLDVMEIGGGETGRSWAARTHSLLESYGPFRLAFLEALVRIADWRASEKEKSNPGPEGADDA